jgi:4-diphosphocytidyl-2-C-methyl-D-erythritol kinase
VHEAIVEPAPAKLTLFLRVLGRREDGYHDIESLILPLSLADDVTVRRTEQGLDFRVTGPLAAAVPPPPQGINLALLAAEALYEYARDDPGKSAASVELTKRIPVAAGLGGGSADAAAVLRALDRLWGLDLGPDRFLPLAAELGSDVPALLDPRPVLARGRGERVEAAQIPGLWWVLMVQAYGVSAADAYRWWDEDGGHTGPDPVPVIDAAEAGDVDALSSLVFNDLERPVAGRHPEVIEATRVLLEAGTVGTIMCGSGPTVAGLCRDGEQAAEVASATSGMAVNTIVHPPEASS